TERAPRAAARPADLIATSHGRFALEQDRFSNLAAVIARHGHELIDGVVFDLGVSSMQLDEAERGFSFRADGPLDMRMASARASAPRVGGPGGGQEPTSLIPALRQARDAPPRRPP